MNTALILRILLIIHIAGGTTALVSGLVAMLTHKGGVAHRRAGKIYFWGMTGVFISAVVLSLAKDNIFLLLVGFFSYYLTARGYRILYLRQLSSGQKATAADWLITGVAALFIIALTGWGIFLLMAGYSMGVVAIAFAFIGALFVRKDILQFVRPPKEKDALVVWPHQQHGWQLYLGIHGLCCNQHPAAAISMGVMAVAFSGGYHTHYPHDTLLQGSFCLT